VHDDVDPAEALLDGVEGFGHGLLVRDIAGNGHHPATGGGYGLDSLISPGLVAGVVHGDGHAITGEPF
jgi:hypothetical protein